MRNKMLEKHAEEGVLIRKKSEDHRYPINLSTSIVGRLGKHVLWLVQV